MLKKIIYIILIIAVIAGGVYAWFYFLKPAAQNNQAAPSPSLPLSSSQSQTPSPASVPLSNSITDSFPKTDTINIGTGSGSIEVKNFYKIAVDTEEGFVILEDNADYQISYDRSTSNFYIYLKTGLAQQSKAENQLLSILGISQQDICRLKVFALQARQANAAKLSFCAGL